MSEHIILILIIIARATRILVLEAGTIFPQHAEIMLRVLKIIFGLDTVARELRVARHALVFLEQLGGIAALAVILPVARLTTEILAPLSTTAATAAALTIVDQMPTSLRSVACPLVSDGQGCAGAPPLILSFRSARQGA